MYAPRQGLQAPASLRRPRTWALSRRAMSYWCVRWIHPPTSLCFLINFSPRPCRLLGFPGWWDRPSRATFLIFSTPYCLGGVYDGRKACFPPILVLLFPHFFRLILCIYRYILFSFVFCTWFWTWTIWSNIDINRYNCWYTQICADIRRYGRSTDTSVISGDMSNIWRYTYIWVTFAGHVDAHRYEKSWRKRGGNIEHIVRYVTICYNMLSICSHSPVWYVAAVLCSNRPLIWVNTT